VNPISGGGVIFLASEGKFLANTLGLWVLGKLADDDDQYCFHRSAGAARGVDL
jgi:hypothetical protein